MNTVMIRKSDNAVVAFMSTETTVENMLGNASESEYAVLFTDKLPIVGGVASISEGTVMDITPPTQKVETDYKALYAAAETNSERIAIIAQKLGLMEAK
ncbi:MAG: hypothetical protein PHV11_07570 [Candidatus Bipolaricaulis sp.]|nr:hypothetical protein [Candidatus Bipolaricaulis sp.]